MKILSICLAAVMLALGSYLINPVSGDADEDFESKIYQRVSSNHPRTEDHLKTVMRKTKKLPDKVKTVVYEN